MADVRHRTQPRIPCPARLCAGIVRLGPSEVVPPRVAATEQMEIDSARRGCSGNLGASIGRRKLERIPWCIRTQLQRKDTCMQLARLQSNSRHSRSLRFSALTLLAVGSLFGQSTNPLELLKQPTPPANERIAYDKAPLQFGE